MLLDQNILSLRPSGTAYIVIEAVCREREGLSMLIVVDFVGESNHRLCGSELHAEG